MVAPPRSFPGQPPILKSSPCRPLSGRTPGMHVIVLEAPLVSTLCRGSPTLPLAIHITHPQENQLSQASSSKAGASTGCRSHATQLFKMQGSTRFPTLRRLSSRRCARGSCRKSLGERVRGASAGGVGDNGAGVQEATGAAAGDEAPGRARAPDHLPRPLGQRCRRGSGPLPPPRASSSPVPLRVMLTLLPSCARIRPLSLCASLHLLPAGWPPFPLPFHLLISSA